MNTLAASLNARITKGFGVLYAYFHKIDPVFALSLSVKCAGLAVICGCASRSPAPSLPHSLRSAPPAVSRPAPPPPPMPTGMTFRPASAVTIFTVPEAIALNSPVWATNELPCTYQVIPADNPESPALWMLAASCVIPPNRFPLKVSLEFMDTFPYPAWTSWVSDLVFDAPLENQPFFFAIPVNVDTVTSVRVRTD